MSFISSNECRQRRSLISLNLLNTNLNIFFSKLASTHLPLPREMSAEVVLSDGDTRSDAVDACLPKRCCFAPPKALHAPRQQRDLSREGLHDRALPLHKCHNDWKVHVQINTSSDILFEGCQKRFSKSIGKGTIKSSKKIHIVGYQVIKSRSKIKENQFFNYQ